MNERQQMSLWARKCSACFVYHTLPDCSCFHAGELNRQLSSCYLSTFLHISQYIGHIARSLFPSAFDFSFTAALSFNSKGAFSDVDKLKEAQI